MRNDSSSSIPTKAKIQAAYEHYRPYLASVMNNIQRFLQDNIRLSSRPTYKARIKDFDSYYKKILHHKLAETASPEGLVCTSDMIGIRIICTFLEDVPAVRDQIGALFAVREVEVKGAAQSFKEFGYESVHVLAAIPENCLPEQTPDAAGRVEFTLPDSAVCEIQIRTILQDAWAEVEHELIYKTEFTPFDMPLRRKLASMNASLSLADIIFQEVRDYQKKLQCEMNERRRIFYKKADELTSPEPHAAPAGTGGHIERVNPYVKGTIDDMLLDAIHAHNAGDIDRAIEIYTRIIEAKPESAAAMSVIYKHRGMAYFTRNDYDSALDDFKKSFEFDPSNFRSVYYEGIVHSIRKDFRAAADCFTASLNLNGYQSHAFYRRALAYFELNEYENAMSDVAAAMRLGLNDEACRALHEKLVAKFDMNM